ncbi:MAG: UvrD-helicase domain-containing protein [Acidobacteria bacterium]|nr:UvrD-helicase domain-containing protein [Acidobacteriota bacterium]
MSARVVKFPASPGSGDKGDAAARAAIADDLDTTLVVEAAAGTGKTTELVKRILRVLATGRATMVQIVAVTFTEKAAGELKLRLREALENDRAATEDEAVKRRLEDALETLEEAHVNTIHGFCAELLRERPVEARVDPQFSVLTEPRAVRVYARAFHAWLEDALQDPPEGVRRALRRSSAPSFMGGGDSSGPVDRLRGAGYTLAQQRDFPAPWSRPPFDRAAGIDRLVAGLHRLAKLSAGPSYERDNLFVDLDAVRRLSRQIELEQSFKPPPPPVPGVGVPRHSSVAPQPGAGGRDLDGWEARLVDLTRDRGFSRTRKGSGYKYNKDVTRTEVLGARDALFAEMQQFRKDADADLAASLQQELAGATARYQDLKRAAGALDFTDLLARARDLIKTDEGVRRHLQQKFMRIFVDEFQDTDPIQAEILLLLAGNVPGKLFIVGDPKQAIYRFRGADVETYWRVRDQLRDAGGRVLQLTTSYRSVPAIQRFVNAAFTPIMTGDRYSLQADYVPLSESRQSDDSQPAIVVLPVPEPYSKRGPLKASPKAIEASLPDAVGAFIAWLVDEKNGWGIQPRDIAVLFRRFVTFGEDVTRQYVDAMEARGVPHLLVGGKAFHGREEVETIRAALAAIEWPDDELSVFAALKGSLFAIDDEPLLEFRHRFGAFHPFRVPKELGGNSGQDLVLTGEPTAHLMPIAAALRALQQLHRGRNYRPVADTIGRLLTETRAHVGLILRPAGEQALANVLHIAELARQYEAGGGISFRGFIDELRDAASEDAAEAPILEEGSDGVRLMTVHKAKGLEFKVVILADLTCRMSRADASRHLDASRGLCATKIGGWAPHELHQHEQEEVARDEAEGVRLAYVAATRAKDLLVVPAIGDDPWEGGWISPLNTALYPPAASRRDGKRGPKCPAFKSKDSVVRRPNDEVASPTTVAPGQHTFDAGYSVVWWDPSALDLGLKPTFGVRREDLIVKDVPRSIVGDGRSKYDRWQLKRADARAAGAVPSLVVETARERSEKVEVGNLKERETTPDSRLQTIDLRSSSDAERSGGAGFGTLVHAILASSDFSLPTSDFRALADRARVEARVLGLTEEDARAARDVAARVLQHDLLARARAAEARGVCRRETPVTCTLDDGTLVEGVVDLAFEDNGRWIVVDYKTDREIAEDGEDRYRRQISLYATAIARATGLPAECVLVRL